MSEQKPGTTFTVEEFRREKGHCWIARLPDVFPRSPCFDAVVYEDGVPLGPSNSVHEHIRNLGLGRYSVWGQALYLSASDNGDPSSNGRTYTISMPFELPVFPKLAAVRQTLGSHEAVAYDPAGGDQLWRLRTAEAKVEYLLDEIYRLKSLVRTLLPTVPIARDLHEYQVSSFNYQWRHVPYHVDFPTNPEWHGRAIDYVLQRVGLEAEWFKGKRILDCGCGPGRHDETFARLGAAEVVAFDSSENALARARELCARFPQVHFEQRSITDPLPYDTDFDLVWSHGVLHCTVDPFGALKNISRHVRPGGRLYIMVYPEPERANFYDYQSRHEAYTIQEALRNKPFAEKVGILENIDGKDRALDWFDAVSSQLNELYTLEEIEALLQFLGFENILRMYPEGDDALDVVATRKMV